MKVALILGSADCLWEDVREAEDVIEESGAGADVELVALNDVGAWFPRRIHAWATLHPEKLGERDPDDPDGFSWLQRRSREGHPQGFRTYGRRRPDIIHEAVQPWGGGSAALYGVRVAEHRGAAGAILCGCPLVERPHVAESTTAHTVSENLEDYRRAWERRIQRDHRRPGRYVRERTRSIRGWTRQLLGYPDPDWIRRLALTTPPDAR